MATVAELTRERAALERDVAFLQASFNRLEQSGASATARRDARIALAEAKAELALNATNLRNAIAAEKPVDTAGAVVTEEQTGRQQNANTTMPPGGNLIQTGPDGRVVPPGQPYVQTSQNQPNTGYAPSLGIYDQSIINTVKNGNMIMYRKGDGGCTTVSNGCPCQPLTAAQAGCCST
jgi:hypothetical protein